MRHAFSQGNEDKTQYSLQGNSRLGLTDLGWRQAIFAGEFFADYLRANPSKDATLPMRVYMSTFERTRQTTRGLLEGARYSFASVADIRATPALIEIDTGHFMHYPDRMERAKQYPLESKWFDEERKRDPYYAKSPNGQSPRDVHRDISLHIGTLMRDAAKGHTDSFNVTHGVTLRVFGMAFMHIDPHYYRDFSEVQNAGIYVIEGDGGNYTFKQIWNGETQRPVDINLGEMLHAGKVILPELPEKYRSLIPN